jgi:peptidoglycan/xylan/chitin deacetylase (PgdA/CDA1 family)
LSANAADNNAFPWPHRSRAAVSLSFDDARASQADRGLDLLDALGARATFYVMPGGVRDRLDRWQRAVARGHEIGNHTLTHPCSGNFPWARSNALEDYTVERMERELDDANNAIRDLLGVTPTTFAYPCGQTFVGRGAAARSYVPVVAKRFRVGRGYQGECVNDPSFCDLAQVSGVGLDGRTFGDLAPLLHAAVRQRGWLVLAGHDFGDGGVQTVIVRELETLCRYCADRGNGIWLDTVDRIGSHLLSVRGF